MNRSAVQEWLPETQRGSAHLPEASQESVNREFAGVVANFDQTAVEPLRAVAEPQRATTAGIYQSNQGGLSYENLPQQASEKREAVATGVGNLITSESAAVGMASVEGNDEHGAPLQLNKLTYRGLTSEEYAFMNAVGKEGEEVEGAKAKAEDAPPNEQPTPPEAKQPNLIDGQEQKKDQANPEPEAAEALPHVDPDELNQFNELPESTRTALEPFILKQMEGKNETGKGYREMFYRNKEGHVVARPNKRMDPWIRAGLAQALAAHELANQQRRALLGL